MKKILLIGSGGSGKSTLARRIAARTGLPLIHLDALYWRAGWVEPSKEAWKQQVADLISADAWVMDGNYGGTLDLRLAACDTVIFLDTPPLICIWRVVKRRLRFHHQTRPDMAEGCTERLDWDFFRWIWRFRQQHRPKILQKLADQQAEGKQVLILATSAQVERFVAQLKHHAGC